MTNTNEHLMIEAISLAEQCKPVAERIPKVGAIIAIGDVVLGRGYRGSGKPNDDDHAEMVAINEVANKKQLPRATIYTTLEPCTREVRSQPLKCCTELITQFGLRSVFISILDPNQGVRGKGLWELQSRGINVELFPPKLAKRLRALNTDFIQVQQTYGIEITNLQSLQTIRTYDKKGVFEVKGGFLNQPGADVFAFTGIGGQWWPQPYPLRVTGNGTWATKVHFGSYGLHTICIVKANDLGIDLIKYYRRVTDLNVDREAKAKQYFAAKKIDGAEILQLLKHKYPGIEMGALPKGVEVQAMVDVIVESPPPTALEISQIR